MNAHTGFGLPTRTTRYGERIEAPSFIRRRWEPRDEHTTDGLLELARALGVALRGADKRQKVLRCLSDVCRAVRSSAHGLVAWPTGSSEMMGPPYGKDIAREVRDALARDGLLSLYQHSSKRDNLARIYQISPVIYQPGFKFKMHRDYPPVEIRSGRKMVAGKKFGGVALGRRRFLGQIEPLEEQVFRINEAMALHPLTGKEEEGRPVEYCGARRIFGSSSLSFGGRLYGSWQQRNEHERLNLKIDGDQVCEIDIKACYLSIVYARFGGDLQLAEDPYSVVPFVYECNDKAKWQRMREICKRLVAAYLCKDGDLNQYPKLDIRDKETGKLIPFRKHFGLEKPVGYFMKQIREAFPFLQQQKEHGLDLMFQESNIVIESMIRLLDLGKVSFPVHDSLIVKLTDKDLAVSILSEVMLGYIGYVPALDVAFFDQLGIRQEERVKSRKGDSLMSELEFRHLPLKQSSAL